MPSGSVSEAAAASDYAEAEVVHRSGKGAATGSKALGDSSNEEHHRAAAVAGTTRCRISPWSLAFSEPGCEAAFLDEFAVQRRAMDRGVSLFTVTVGVASYIRYMRLRTDEELLSAAQFAVPLFVRLLPLLLQLLLRPTSADRLRFLGMYATRVARLCSHVNSWQHSELSCLAYVFRVFDVLFGSPTTPLLFQLPFKHYLASQLVCNGMLAACLLGARDSLCTVLDSGRVGGCGRLVAMLSCIRTLFINVGGIFGLAPLPLLVGAAVPGTCWQVVVFWLLVPSLLLPGMYLYLSEYRSRLQFLEHYQGHVDSSCVCAYQRAAFRLPRLCGYVCMAVCMLLVLVANRAAEL